MLVDATVPHEAGASEAQELAYLAATLVAYLRAFEAAGVAPKDALPTIAFALSVDTDLFLNAAKVRAARTIIARIAEASGASPASVHITAVSSARMMAKRDPWTNMLRTTAACAAATFGSADAITVLPYTWALGVPDRFARRVARNTQLVLQEESQLGRVVDPIGGSWYVEKLTDELAQRAWTLFQDIEAEGGIVAALSSGGLQDDIAKVAETRARSIATGRVELTGVSVFPFLGDDGVKVTPYAEPAPLGKPAVRPLTPHRLGEAFEKLRDAGDAFFAKTGKRKRIFMANLGEIAEHNKRSQWMWNFLAAGGIEGLTSDGYKNAADAAAAFKASGAKIACICSSDEVYAREAEAAAKALKQAGATRVLLAGRPGEAEQALRAAGVDGFLFAGQDAIAVLEGAAQGAGAELNSSYSCVGRRTGGTPVASLRFLASLFALIAIVALVADATPALNGTGAFTAHSVIGYWTELAPASLRRDARQHRGDDVPVGVEPDDPQRAQRADVDAVRLPRRRLRLFRPPPRAAQGARQLAALLLLGRRGRCRRRRRRAAGMIDFVMLVSAGGRPLLGG